MIPLSYPKAGNDSSRNHIGLLDYVYVQTPKSRIVAVIPEIGFLALVEPCDVFEKPDLDITEIELNSPHSGDYIKSLTLFLEHRCNYRCDYCFPSEHKLIDNQKQLSIALETIRPIIKSFVEQIPAKAYASITLFGGEPLLHKDIMEILDFINEERMAQRKDCDVIIFTNGSLIDDVLVDKIKNRKYCKIIVSIDGPPELNDLHRVALNGDSASTSTINGLRKLDCIEPDRIIGRITINDDIPLTKQRIVYLIEKIKLKNITLEIAFNKNNLGAYINRLDNLSKELPEICDYYVSQLK